MEYIRTNSNKPLRAVTTRIVRCQDCDNTFIKTYKGCKVKHPRCFKCKSTNTTIEKDNYE